MTEYISVVIAALALLATVYNNNKNGKNRDVVDAVRQARESERIATKLDGIASDVRETRNSMEKIRDDVALHGSRITKVEESTKSAHHRIDELVKLHNRCCGAEHQYNERREGNA